MDNPLHDIDKLFRHSLEPAEETPSAKVWNEINKKLDKEDRKKPGAAFWAKRAALLLLMTGLMFGSYQFFNPKTNAGLHNIAVTVQKERPSALNIDTIKKENIGDENKTAFEKESIGQIGNDTVLNKNKSTVAGTNTDRKNEVEKNIIQTKRIFRVTTKKDSNSKIAQNKHFKKTALPNAINRKNEVPSIGSNSTIQITKKNQSVANKTQNSFENNKKNSGNDDGQRILSNVVSNNNKKTGIVAGNLKPNIDLESDRQRLLNVKKAFIDIQDSSTLQPLLALNLSNIQAGDLSLLKLTNDSKPKKAVFNKQPFTSNSRFYISLFAAPEWQGYQLQDNDDQQSNSNQNQGGDTKNKIKHREDEDASLVAGIGFGYRLDKKLSIESGIRYSEYDINTDSIKLYAAINNATGSVGYRINTSLGYGYLNNTSGTLLAVGDSMVVRNLRQSVTNLAMPLLLRYQVGKGRLSFEPALGLMFNFILGSNIRTNLGNGQRQTVSLLGLKKVSVGMLVAPSVYYRITNHISFGLEPYFNYTISPINKATVVDSYPYGFGLGENIRYQF